MKKTIIGIVVIVLIAAALFLALGAHGKALTYSNSLVGYEMHLAPGWHVSEGLTRTIDHFFYLTTLYGSVGCGMRDVAPAATGTDPLGNMRTCAEKRQNYAELQSKDQAFANAWSVGKSELVLLTNFSSDEENAISLDQLIDPNKLPKGRFIALRPFDQLISFAASSTSSTGLVRDFFKLNNGTQAYLDDWRASNFPQQGLVLSIPVHANSYLYSGEKTESLTAISSAEKGSAAETDFFSMAKTITVK